MLQRILLKFEKLRDVISKIKQVYGEIAVDGSLNFEGLERAMNALHGHMERDEIANLFEFVDLDSSKSIEFKEFLVALTVGHVLEIVPTFQGIKQTSQLSPDALNDISHGSKAKDGEPAPEAPSTRTKKTEEIHRMLNLIVSAYLLFDPNANGYIERESVEVLIGEGKRKNAMLSQQRWDEMVRCLLYNTGSNATRIGMLMVKLTLQNLYMRFQVGWILKRTMSSISSCPCGAQEIFLLQLFLYSMPSQIDDSMVVDVLCYL